MATEVKFPFNPGNQADSSAAPAVEATPPPAGEHTVITTEPAQATPPVQDPPAITPPPPATDNEEAEKKEPATTDLDDDALLALLQKKGFKGKSIEDLTKDPVTPQPATEDYDEDTKKFIEYRTKTGRGLKDWNELNKDVTKMDPLDAARDRIRKENEGADLTPEEINYLLEDELGFDPSEEGLSEAEKAKFKKYYSSHINNLKKEQQKLNEPVEGFTPTNAVNTSQPEPGGKVKLSNGVEVDAETYEKERAEYLKLVDESLQGIKEQKFSYSIDGKDGKEEFTVDYNLTDEDLHSVRSEAEDVGSLLNPYQKEDGFDMKQFQEDLFWKNPANRQKAISAMARNIRSQVIAEMVGKRKNFNFNSPADAPAPKNNAGYREPGDSGNATGYGVKYSMPS